jgi:hypothetical protein
MSEDNCSWATARNEERKREKEASNSTAPLGGDTRDSLTLGSCMHGEGYGPCTQCKANDEQERGLDAIQFGVRVLTKVGDLTSEWIFIGWNETHDSLWLARPYSWEDAYYARRGPQLLLYPQAHVHSFQNVERYGPAVQLPA